MINIFNIFKPKVVAPKVNVFDRLYPYQKQAVQTTSTNVRGIICMPTGVGKTFCQAAIIADDIIKNYKQFRMYVVNAPRIMLSYQLLKEVYGFLVREGIEARYMFVHSGGKTDEKELEEVRLASQDEEGQVIPFSEIGSGTSPIVIRKMMEKAKAQKLPLIFFSTYNSAERIEEARQQASIRQPISIVLNDEAHYLVQEQFHDILRTLPSPRCYFFTATMIQTPSDKGRGMNNANLYGEKLYLMLPIEAILLGKMVRPRLHFVTTEGVYNTDDYNKSLNKIITDTFAQHEKVLTKTNQLPKVLISAKGTQDILNFLRSTEYQKLRQEGVDIYAVASTDEIGNDVNGEKVRRQDFLKRLKADGENKAKRLIVLHYDILAEGIDVSGFTGIMPLRTLNKSKFLQTFGRAARPDKEDRIKIDTKVITVNDLKLMNKPYSYIMIPNIIHSNEDDKANMTQLITELRTYGFKPSEDIVSSSLVHGIPELEELDGLNDVKIKIPNAGQIIQNLEADIEAETDAQLSKTQLLNKLFN
jgi:superfamily II DNA or RNA helicase